jgi:hypothetical protein
MTGHLLLLALLFANPAEKANDASTLAEVIFNLGESARREPLRNDQLLYQCADAAACAGPCAKTLNWIGDSREYEHTAELCAELKPRDDKEDIQARAASWVRKQLVDSSKRLSAKFSELERAKAACGLGRLKLGPAAPDACVVAEIDVGTTTLSGVPAAGIELLAAFCSELEACAGPCQEELKLVSAADLATLPLAKVAAGAKADGCTTFADLPATGAVEPLLADRVKARVRDFGALACKRADAKTSAALSCALARLGVTPAPGPCGVAGATCPPPPPRKLPKFDNLSH